MDNLFENDQLFFGWSDNLAPDNLAPDNLAPRQFGTNIVAYYPSRPLLTLVAKLSYNLFDKILKSLSMID